MKRQFSLYNIGFQRVIKRDMVIAAIGNRCDRPDALIKYIGSTLPLPCYQCEGIFPLTTAWQNRVATNYDTQAKGG